VKLEPDSPSVHYTLARAYQRAGQLQAHAPAAVLRSMAEHVGVSGRARWFVARGDPQVAFAQLRDVSG